MTYFYVCRIYHDRFATPLPKIILWISISGSATVVTVATRARTIRCRRTGGLWIRRTMANMGDDGFQRLFDQAKADLEREDGARAEAAEVGTDTGTGHQDNNVKREGANATTQKAEGGDASTVPPTDAWRPPPHCTPQWMSSLTAYGYSTW
jgi:hypothetical protein